MSKFEECNEKCCDFESEHGSIELIKAGISVINKILVDKGIVSEDEIQEAMIKKIDRLNKSGLDWDI